MVKVCPDFFFGGKSYMQREAARPHTDRAVSTAGCAQIQPRARRTPGREHPTHLSLSTADKNIDSINFVDLKFCFFVVLPG